MILISKPYLYDFENRVRLATIITIDGNTEEVWLDVDTKYKEYLCYERADAFVAGILHFAMLNNHNIICDAKLGEYFYYQIITDLIPAVCSGSSAMHFISITAEIDHDILPNAHGVGTGISCGVDSLYAIASQLESKFYKHKLTHLMFNNVGSHGEGKKSEALYLNRKKRAASFCKENGFELIDVNSNIMEVVTQSHFLTSSYTAAFSILGLQKLFSIYYLASGSTFKEFSLKDNHINACSDYDLLLLQCFSSDQTKIYSEGASISRMQKLKTLINYPPSYKYLNVCTLQDKNCGRCEKCTRTMLELEVLGALDRYKEVFNLDYFHQHKHKYLQTIYHNVININDFSEYYLELYPYYKNKISLLDKLYVRYRLLYRKLQYFYWKYYINHKSHH